jgi:glucose/arabinose dehydrogenase
VMTGGTVIGRERRRLAAAGAATLLALVCWLAAGGSARAGAAEFELVDIGNFDEPMFVDDAPGAEGHLYVVEKPGTIAVLRNEVERNEKFLDIEHLVTADGEEGLLSVAFDPNYDQNRRFYVYYTTNGHDIRIDQFRRRKDDRFSAGIGSREPVIKIEHDQADNHNGGQLQFDQDGYLYAGIGDGGPQGDPENDAQKKNRLLGKLLRIDPKANGGYVSPPDNPFVGQPGRDEIAAIGLRNPWRFSFDSATGALLLADVGGGAREEVNYAANQGVGENFGWNDYEGLVETNFGTGEDASPHHAPIADFDHTAVGLGGDDFCAITGGYVVHDPELPALANQYVFSDLCRSDVFSMQVPAGGDYSSTGVSAGSIVSFGEGEGGQIYVAGLGGDVFRLEQLPG